MTAPIPAFRIAITGSMGCGKSATARAIGAAAATAGLRCNYVEADEARRALLEEGDLFGVQAEIAKRFGREVVRSGGGIDRAALASLTYSDDARRADLDALLDPILLAELRRLLSIDADLALLDWALVVEKGCLDLTDYNCLLVHCREETQLARLQGGDLPFEQVKRRIALQNTNFEKKAAILSSQARFLKGLYLELDTDHQVGPDTISFLLDQIAGAAGFRKIS